MGFKIFNDPVHGFIEVPRGLLLDVLDHPVFQRLRHIRQMGLSSLVYPGAVHSRFSHALGAMHLTHQALDTLARKGVAISPEEHQATLAAILLHDVGHGPFSHGLERILVPGIDHEALTEALMAFLDDEFGGALGTARAIFNNTYPRPFFHQLISGQLDMDRMDYLIRDSFFTGVQEGIVGSERIIKTLTVTPDDRLAVEEKGIYSVEKFIVARRLMYWQVYLHKTALCAEKMLVRTLQRARRLALVGTSLGVPGPLPFFLALNEKPALDPTLLERFCRLGDDDINFALKQWAEAAPDPVLQDLSRRIMHRRLLKLRFSNQPVDPGQLAAQRAHWAQELALPRPEDAEDYVFAGEVSNLPYIRRLEDPEHTGIPILGKDGNLRDLADAADMSNLHALSQRLTKHYVCTPG